jgi:CheY-specific phosphatase CheX
MESMMNFDVRGTIVDSVIEVYDMMLSMAVNYSEDNIQNGNSCKHILGSINLVGEVAGIVNIEVSEKFSRQMAAVLMDISPDEIESMDEVQDVLGEICNIVAGSLKSGLCDAGMECELSTPAIIMGQDYNHEARNMKRNEKIVFAQEENIITVYVGLKPADMDLEEGRSPAEKDKIHGDIDIFDYDMGSSVTNSVSEVFGTMFSMEVSPYVGKNGTGLTCSRIVGSISLSGKVLGRVNLHIPESFSRFMASSMFGIEPDEMEGLDEAKDVVGELCNMISGALKSDLCDAGLECRVSPPSFTTGSDFEVECLNLIRHERFMFSHGEDVFMVEVGLKPGDR